MEHIAPAEIDQVIVKRCCDIKMPDIAHEHDPACRTYVNLVRTLKKVYRGFNEEEIVSIISFTYRDQPGWSDGYTH